MGVTAGQPVRRMDIDALDLAATGGQFSRPQRGQP